MAAEDRKLANGASHIDFQTDPSRYRHWKLAVDGEIATLTMDVDENGGLFEGYQLKLNSYDLGVDIELADAVQRLRFEHPQVKTVLLRSGKNRVFCAGANIRMLAGATHAHKVNFCKFTNETRNGIEDSSANSGQRFICVVNGTAAGGGYELALATDHIILVDDGSAAVSLPEVPLLAVLPGTGGLTRVTDKRKVRRDHADYFCTFEEGVKGKRAVQWRLVDEIAPNSKLEARVAERAREFAAASPRSAAGRGRQAHAADAHASTATAFATVSSASISIAQGAPRPFRSRRRMRRRRRMPRPIKAQGASFWPLQVARELDDAILHLRINELEMAVLVFKSDGDPASVLAYDALLDAHKDDWFVNEVRHYWKRVLKRIDVTSRTLVSADRAGLVLCRHAGRTRVRVRPLLHADRLAAGRQPRAAEARAERDEFRSLSDEPRPDAAGVALPGRSVRPRGCEGASGRSARCGGGRRARPRHLRARRHRLGRRGARVLRGAHQLLAGQPHRAWKRTCASSGRRRWNRKSLRG